MLCWRIARPAFCMAARSDADAEANSNHELKPARRPLWVSAIAPRRSERSWIHTALHELKARRIERTRGDRLLAALRSIRSDSADATACSTQLFSAARTVRERSADAADCSADS